jgi:hypothetical protein
VGAENLSNLPIFTHRLKIALRGIVAKGFINLNRFKQGRAIKRDSKQKANLQGSKRLRGKLSK